ncbi:hypothetical protein PSPO_b1372 [Pseudoalteromonas spongiae UST010723-006]|nr:hypothetical protein PSPO_b1372 [Pseudoalteromonas spongiae UST010723-006]
MVLTRVKHYQCTKVHVKNKACLKTGFIVFKSDIRSLRLWFLA